MQMNSILDLPPELIHVCLSYLPLSDIHTLEHFVGNTLLRSLIAGSVAIAYRRALDSACVEESPAFAHPTSSPPPVSDRLRLLHRTNERFAAFDPTHRASLTVPFPTTSIYDLAGDVFVLGDGSGEMIDGRCTGVRVLRTRAAAAAAAPQNEGPAEGVDEDVWRRINAGKPIIDFGLAVEEHDLIVMVTYVSVDQTRRQIDVSFFHFSTGAPHSQARQHVLPVQETDTAHGPPSVSIEIVGENLAMSLFYGNARTADKDSLHVFNWRTGIRKKSDFFPLSSPGLIFLTPRHLLFPDVRVQCFVVVEYPDSDSEDTEPELSLLEFPDIKGGQEVLHVQCRVSPTAAASPTPPAPSAPSSRFVPRAEDAIILLSFTMGRFDQQGLLEAADDHIFVVSKRPLYDKLFRGPMARERLSWDEWAAPAMCYLDGEDLHFRYITVTHGQRLVYIDHAATEVRAPVRILDFNAGRFEDALRRGAVDGPHAVVQPMEGGKVRGILRQVRTFRRSLVSTLPYVETTSKELFDWGAAIINDECILGVQFGVIAHALSLEVLHFGEL
ncbi:unnamed protein product [Mycena citricolor]|uniref:F-box domain-containing protein n=1 Tax=Mycena citricolor TaxID=2018698 RepID=A0AAD2HBE7_9AGAR|nr:unnamed protein product [Mycena citricolor]